MKAGHKLTPPIIVENHLAETAFLHLVPIGSELHEVFNKLRSLQTRYRKNKQTQQDLNFVIDQVIVLRNAYETIIGLSHTLKECYRR